MSAKYPATAYWLKRGDLATVEVRYVNQKFCERGFGVEADTLEDAYAEIERRLLQRLLEECIQMEAVIEEIRGMEQ